MVRRFWLLGWWGWERVPFDQARDLWVDRKIRPGWYYRLLQLRLFTRIVWREWEPGYRLSIVTAWTVSCIVHRDPQG